MIRIGEGINVAFEKKEFNPKLPYKMSINGFSTPQTIQIIGQCHKGSKGFHVNFNDNNDTIFHFNPRFKEKCVVRNSTNGGVWQNEEREESEFPFHHDKIFTLDFIAHQNHVECKYDGKYFLKFAYRKNHRNMTLLEIDGDVEIHHISIQRG
uniref:Galectin n=1 Tax=Parastrongyloides trichosuri TaxID=131310 RepID=A0A0N4ZNB9_PARTI